MTKRVLTPTQSAFLDQLIPCRGNIREAMRAAGYSDAVSIREVVTSLRQEIRDVAEDALIQNVVRASLELRDQIDNPTKGGATVALKAAESILDRVGPKNDEVKLNVPQGGLIIMPAKKGSVDETEVPS